MNTTTKVFIILNLLLALGFAYMQMLTYATRENWKRRWDQDTQQLSRELKAANEATARASAQESIAKSSLVQANDRIQVLERDLVSKESEISDKENEIINKDQRISSQDEQIQAQILQIQNLNETLARTRQRNNELNNIAAVARAVAFKLNVRLAELEDDFNNSEVELQRRQETIARLETDARRKDARLALVRERYKQVWQDITSDTPPAAVVIEGMVAAVHRNPQGQQDLVMITVGSDTQVEPNQEFIIYRDNKYITKVRIVKVLDDMAAARVIPEAWNTRGYEIQQGDMAQNRLW
jgi:hypothetical protein